MVIVAIWHVTVFIACVKLPASYFDETKPRFRARDWERGGRWYKDTLRINAWKDRIPQYAARNGFSKEHLERPDDLTIDYINEFIMETCRGEWMHLSGAVRRAAAGDQSHRVWIAVCFSESARQSSVCRYSALQPFPPANAPQAPPAHTERNGCFRCRYGFRVAVCVKTSKS